MKQRLIIPVMAAVMLLGGCSNETTGDTPGAPGEKGCLVFDVESVETRGTSTTTATIREFGVFCFDTGQSKWEDVKASATPNKLYNQQVVRTDAVWSYDPPVYWENYQNKLHSFFAYSPMAKGMLATHSDGNNIELIGTQATTGVPALKFELLDDVSDHVDLLIAGEHLDLKPRDKVVMNFKHALSRIGFKAFSEVAGTYIEKIEIRNIPHKGTLTMVSPAVWTVESSTKDFTLDYGSGIPILAPEANAIDISAPGRYLMAIPSKWTNNTTAQVEVYYRQGGVAIKKEFLIGSTGEEWTQHRSVTYLLDLNGKPNNDLIVEKVIIEEWQMGTITSDDVGLKGEDYLLHFDANTTGNVSNLPPDVTLESGTLYKIPNIIPVDAGGKTFNGWNTAAGGNGTSYNIGERVPINDAAVTLYAQWN